MTSHCSKSCDSCQDTSLSSVFRRTPTLLWLTPLLGLNTSSGMELLCLVGAVLSMVLLVSQRCRDCIAFLLLWFLYYSMVQVGQIFIWYQWDGLLWETGFLAILIAPWNIGPARSEKQRCFYCKRDRNTARHHDAVSLWLVKWLLFRLMFASGVVKLYFMDTTWWELTAMYWHYESQCIPTPVAWYFHKLPKWFHRLSVVITYVIEMGLPFLFFVPVRVIRIFAYFGQVFLQLLILITGNYNFFNLLTMTLCISLLDDVFITTPITCSCSSNCCRKKYSKSVQDNVDSAESSTTGGEKVEAGLNKFQQHKKKTNKGDDAVFQSLLTVFISRMNSKGSSPHRVEAFRDFTHSTMAGRIKTASIAASFLATMVTIGILINRWFWFETTNGGLYSWIAFSPADFRYAVDIATLAAIWVGLISLMLEIVSALLRCFLEGGERLKQTCSLVQCVAVSLVALLLFAVSLEPFTDISPRTKSKLPSSFRGWYKQTKYLEVAHPYGLFRSMTGVGGRPEIIILGSNSTEGPWKEYDFLYKPGNIYAPPPFVAPHQPRLDWQMWFAALESYESNPWFLSLLHKLLTGEHDVLHLMGANPFPVNPPRYIRAQLFTYHYTQNTSSLGDVLLESSTNTSKAWWSREFSREYLPFIISNDTLSDLERMLLEFRIFRPEISPEPVSGFLQSLVISLRSKHRKTTAPNLIGMLLFIVVALLMFKVWWRRMGKRFCNPTFVKVKGKCEQMNQKISQRTDHVVQICRSCTARHVKAMQCQCFVVLMERFYQLYRGVRLMVEGYWARTSAASTSGLLRVKARIQAIRPPIKKNA
ncbi:lipase maturation factor 2 isoform X2 [Nematostella vectensis]|nr:lipase maturation factor 2 isoform X2 [Nematostella vectensis]